jgi:hypothetical protein
MILLEKIVDLGFGLIDNNKKRGTLCPSFRSVLVVPTPPPSLI